MIRQEKIAGDWQRFPDLLLVIWTFFPYNGRKEKFGVWGKGEEGLWKEENN